MDTIKARKSHVKHLMSLGYSKETATTFDHKMDDSTFEWAEQYANEKVKKYHEHLTDVEDSWLEAFLNENQ